MGSALRHTTLLFALLSPLALAGQACRPATATDRAHTLVRLHRDEEAVALLRERLQGHPDDRAARRLLIVLLGLTGDVGAARTQAAELARQTPAGDPAPALELGHALELAHRYDEALAAYDEAARAAPASPVGPREGGMRTAHWGEAELARPRLEEAVRRGARDGETWHALGVVRLHLGDVDGAEQAYRAGVEAEEGSRSLRDTSDRGAESTGAENWLGLASLALVRGDAVGALAAYDEVLVRRPRFGSAQLGRAWALAKLGRSAEASQALDQAEALGAPAGNVARQRAALGPPSPR